MGLPYRSLHAALAILVLCIGVFGPTACGRWLPLRSYQVQTTGDPATSFMAVEEVVKREQYQVVERHDESFNMTVRTHVDQSSEERQSFITINVLSDGRVTLTPSGYLVKDGTLHQRLEDELSELEQNISGQLAKLAEAAAAPAAPEQEVPPTTPALPRAWAEPSSDPAKWGTGNFTCLPMDIPAADQALIGLRLSTGELAQVTLSLAYDAALCRSPAACPVATGCPALGIGDAEQVQLLAARLSAGEVLSSATLVYRGQPVVAVELNQHGSIIQAQGQVAPAAPAPAPPPAPVQ